MKLKSIIFIIVACLFFNAAHAHHSNAAAYTDEKISIEGTVDKFVFKNPHVVVYVNVKDKKTGEVTRWMSEGPAATGLRLASWDNTTLSVGDYIRISGQAGRSGRPMVSLRNVTRIEPKTGAVIQEISLVRRVVTPSDPESEDFKYPKKLVSGLPNLNGIWVGNEGEDSIGPSFLLNKDPIFTPLGQALQDSILALNDPQYVTCAPASLVRQAGFTPHPVRITQDDDRVTFEYEEYAGKRVVYLDDRDYDKHFEGVHSLMGRYKARYQGESLIIESDLLQSGWSGIFGQVTSNQATVVETYTRGFEPKWGPFVHLSMIVTDPLYLKEPREFFWDKFYTIDGFTSTKSDNVQKDYVMLPVECQVPLSAKK